LFPKVKELLAGQSLTVETVKLPWDRALRCIAVGDFAAAYRRWLERNEKCVRIGYNYVEKS
jgi:hypothetical protein